MVHLEFVSFISWRYFTWVVWKKFIYSYNCRYFVWNITLGLLFIFLLLFTVFLFRMFIFCIFVFFFVTILLFLFRIIYQTFLCFLKSYNTLLGPQFYIFNKKMCPFYVKFLWNKLFNCFIKLNATKTVIQPLWTEQIKKYSKNLLSLYDMNYFSHQFFETLHRLIDAALIGNFSMIPSYLKIKI